MSKRIEVWLLWLAYYIVLKRNCQRARHISRRDNNDLWAFGERIEAIIKRINSDYQ